MSFWGDPPIRPGSTTGPRIPPRSPSHWGIQRLGTLRGTNTNGFLEGLLVVLAGISITAAALLGIALVCLFVNAFFGLFVWGAWNIALVPIVESAGGTLGAISYLQAVGVAFFLNVLRRIFGRTTVKESA